MTARTYRKRPVEIQAFYWDGSDSDEMLDKIADFVGDTMWHMDSSKVYIKTLEGLMSSKAPCYIIRGVRGEYYICDPEIFMETYEAVE